MGGFETFVSKFLSALEFRESQLLPWGFVDGGFTEEEIEDLLVSGVDKDLTEAWLDWSARGIRLKRFISDLEQEGLLHKPVGERMLYRTRFAETVRLLFRLRQVFRQDQWASGPRLVADLKIHLTPRLYPKRNVAPSQVWRELATHASSIELQRQAFDYLSVGIDAFAAFQVRAFVRGLRFYGASEGRFGTVVSAGTGSGKTKAFYVPAFLGIAADLARVPAPFTKVIAIYPRNVLLADQLREALSEAEKLRPLMREQGLRQITFGAFYGDVPPEDQLDKTDSRFLKNWRRTPNGWIVPFLKASGATAGDLVWRDMDRRAGRTTLYDLEDGREALPDGVLALTREKIQRQPPDVLLLSIEMLNRELSNPDWYKTFGIRRDGLQPRMLLLDEIHTYEGLQGAQLPWILRRWFFAARPQGLHVVGLSATLKDPTSHLNSLAGIRVDQVEDVRPIANEDPDKSELVSEGMEYNVAIKGHAGSGASLLATSIQTAMLLSRVLTPEGKLRIDGEQAIRGANFYARKVFGFTDNLDSLNRWLFDLADAESRKRLAQFRKLPGGVDHLGAVARYREGQLWALPERLGHDLNQAKRVTRCSSQDPGVDFSSDIVLATSSLEVGYDDPEVGSVLHHKAPRSVASFVQRKGRAGRRRGTRPMTVVVLSNFGKDKWAFRDSEQLFAGDIPPIRLPVLNPHVLRVQSTQFLIDWLGRRIGRPDPYRYLANAKRDDAAVTSARDILSEIVEGGVARGALKRDFEIWLREASLNSSYSFDPNTVGNAILWDLPRPLLRHAIPALLRRLERRFTLAEANQAEYAVGGRRRPLPEYLPPMTFGELDAREVRVVRTDQPTEEDHISIEMALREGCPGRVSKRFAQAARAGYWLVGSRQLTGGPVALSLSALYPRSLFLQTLQDVDVYQPLEISLEQRPPSLRDSSYASWDIQFMAEPVGAGSEVVALDSGVWERVFASRRAHLHRDGDGVRILRYATAGSYELTSTKGQVSRGTLQLQSLIAGEQRQEAVGFEKTVDGLVLTLAKECLGTAESLPPSVLAHLRFDYFLSGLLRAGALRSRINGFGIELFARTSFAMLCATAIRQHCSLTDAQAALRGRRGAAARYVMERLLGAATSDDDEPSERRVTEQLALWSDTEVLAVLEAAECNLWNPPDGQFNDWLRQRYANTLAQALVEAVNIILPDIPEDEWIADVQPSTAAYEIIVSETVGGGIGHVERLIARIANDPALFASAVRQSIERCRRSERTEFLLDLVSEVRRGPNKVTLSQAFEAVRTAQSFADLSKARDDLRNALGALGHDNGRSEINALVSKVVFPGSSSTTDRWVRGLNARWREEDARLGVVTPAEVFAYWMSTEARIVRRVNDSLEAVSGAKPNEGQVFTVLQNFLQEQCQDSCPECLGSGKPGAPWTKPARQLARRWIGFEDPPRLSVRTGTGWIEEVRTMLQKSASVILEIPVTEMAKVSRDLHSLLLHDVERDYLYAPVSISSALRKGGMWHIRLGLQGIDAGT